VASEQQMIRDKKLPARTEHPAAPPTPRLTEDERTAVDLYVAAYQKRTGERFVEETVSEMFDRKIENIPRMTKSATREELKKRKLHQKNLSEDELKRNLAIVYTKETRRKRLEEAYVTKDYAEIQKIRAEVRTFTILDKKPRTLPRKVEAKMLGIPRKVYINVVQLEKVWTTVPTHVIDHSIMVFDCEREWIFHQAGGVTDFLFDSRYLKFSEEFKEM
jgi:hypothetical protein